MEVDGWLMVIRQGSALQRPAAKSSVCLCRRQRARRSLRQKGLRDKKRQMLSLE